MMRFRTLVVLASGFAAGYLTGTAAGRPAYERIRARASSLASELGLKDAADRIQERGEGVAKASADVAATATREVVDVAADKVEQQLIDAQTRLHRTPTPAGNSHV